MIFTQEFKNKCFKVLQFSTSIQSIMKALETNDSLQVRYYLEEYLDKLNEQLKPRILEDWGSALIYNSVVSQYKACNALYTEFMDLYSQEIDSLILK